MRIGVPTESLAGETRVAATPTTVGNLVALGYDIAIERGAGRAASFPDQAYADAGATLCESAEVWRCDLVLKVNAPTVEEIHRMRSGAILASLLAPALNPDLVDELAASGVTALAMDAVPRISRAQSLDVLSSMANLGGYRAVVEAAHEFGSVFTGQVTAAGKVPPAKVLVVGAGVAGLAAIGTSSSLGAIVRSFDARREVREQVESLGAQFLEIDVADHGPSTTGYASEMSDDFNARATAMYAEQARDVDIIITTALIPGKPAPRLITEDMVASMRPGSVIVDMAAANGGNVAGSRADERVVTANGVIIIGHTDLPARVPRQASQLFATNLANLIKLLTPGKDGEAVLDLADVVQRGMTVCQEGEVLWPAPPITMTADPVPQSAPPATRAVRKPDEIASRPPARKYMAMAVATLSFGLVASTAPTDFLGHITVFALAVIVGFYVISNVTHALHTPLMSETNAISGIILVGALLQIGSSDPLVAALSFAATVVASINIFGGFAVTHRMLQMFRKD